MWGFLGGLFPKSLHPFPNGSGCWQQAVFALHHRVLIGVVCPLRPQWGLLLGQVGAVSTAAKLSGRYCNGAFLDPPKFTTSGFCHRTLPSSPCAFIPNGPPGKPQQRDVKGYPDRDSSRGKVGMELHGEGLSSAGETEARSTKPLFLLPEDICAFCHKALGRREPTVEAMGKQYHAECFTCRMCPRLLAGQVGAGVSQCPPNPQATLEKCAKCQGLITERIVRALGKGFHPDCFCCAACGRAIGAESFAVDEQDEVYCVADFYRLGGMSMAVACERPIIPHEDKDTYKIECLGRSFHESCYCCEVRKKEKRTF
uniref:Filamin binding LIM protein 1 n=1 Tax=Amazona collaria TaxID=241587 RepID=A0A8B9GNI9_9PSIT